MAKVLCTLAVLLATASFGSAKDLKRSKRQLQVYYMCNGGVSQYRKLSTDSFSFQMTSFQLATIITTVTTTTATTTATAIKWSCPLPSTTREWTATRTATTSTAISTLDRGSTDSTSPTAWAPMLIRRAPALAVLTTTTITTHTFRSATTTTEYTIRTELATQTTVSTTHTTTFPSTETFRYASVKTNQELVSFRLALPIPTLTVSICPTELNHSLEHIKMEVGSTSYHLDFNCSISVFLCGASEPSGGVCRNNGICPSGHSCVAGNVCCRCPAGSSAGICRQKSDCSAGYECAATGYCCPSQIKAGTELETCINGMCPDNQTCGVGNLCYPAGFFQ